MKKYAGSIDAAILDRRGMSLRQPTSLTLAAAPLWIRLFPATAALDSSAKRHVDFTTCRTIIH